MTTVSLGDRSAVHVVYGASSQERVAKHEGITGRCCRRGCSRCATGSLYSPVAL